MLVLVAATVNNLLAWLIFSVVLGGRVGGHSITYTTALTVGFIALTLTLGRWRPTGRCPGSRPTWRGPAVSSGSWC